MKTVATCAAIASLLVFTAGSAAWAQTYGTNPGTQGSHSSSTGGYTYDPGAQGYSNYSTNPPGSYNQGTYNQGSNQGSNYGSNQGSWSPGTQSNTTSPSNENMATQGYSANQGTWSSGSQGTSTPYGQSNTQAGYGAGNITTYQQAEQELGRYGYSNIHDLKAMPGWSADAMRNGQRVHVILGENGLIATFPGR
jgi:hypothetical protein